MNYLVSNQVNRMVQEAIADKFKDTHWIVDVGELMETEDEEGDHFLLYIRFVEK